MKHSEIGYWVNVSLQHLRSFSLRSENIDEFETTMIAGEIALLLNAIRGREEVSQNEILRIAKAQKIPRQRCLNQLIPSIELIESQRIIVYRHKNTNEVTLEEHLFTIEQLNEVVGQIWEKLTPSLIERAALHILSSTFVMPRTKTEQINILSDNGFKDQDAEHSLGVSTSFSLVQSVSANKSQDPVIFNGFVA